jgi:amino acid transporter
MTAQEQKYGLLHRITSGILGSLVGIAGAYFGVAYGLMVLDPYANAGESPWSRLVVALIISGVVVGTFYMAFRFLRYAARPVAPSREELASSKSKSNIS